MHGIGRLERFQPGRRLRPLGSAVGYPAASLTAPDSPDHWRDHLARHRPQRLPKTLMGSAAADGKTAPLRNASNQG